MILVGILLAVLAVLIPLPPVFLTLAIIVIVVGIAAEFLGWPGSVRRGRRL